jgi:hypothetical protein
MTLSRTAVERVWWAAGVLGLVTLLMPARPAGDSLGLRRFLTPAVDARWRIGQTFRMNADGLEGIVVRASAVGDVRGSVVLRLLDEEGAILRDATVPAAALVRDEAYDFRFSPIDDSNGRWFRLDVASSSADPAAGVALWATKGERLERGASLRINDVPRWASLAFETRAPRRTPLWSALTSPDPARPPQWLWVVGVVACWLAVRAVLVLVREEGFSDGLLAR